MTRDLDRLLTDALRADAHIAPMPEDLLRVPDEWVRRSAGPRQLARALASVGVVATATVATIALIGLLNGGMLELPWIGNPGESGTVDIRNLDTEPRVLGWVDPAWPAAAGPAVDVVRGSADGRGFSFVVYRSPADDVVCIAFRWGTADPPSCGYGLPGTTPLGTRFGSGASSNGDPLPHVVYGLVATDVAAVWVETTSGERTATELIDLEPAGIDAALFVAFLPGEVESAAWIASDATGRELERFATGGHAVQGPPDGGVPTPASGQLTWISVAGPRDWFAPEPLSLEVGPLAWGTDSGGVVSLDLAEAAELRLFGTESCRMYARFVVEPGTAHLIRFDPSGAVVSVEDSTGGVEAGPAMGTRELSGCGVP